MRTIAYTTAPNGLEYRLASIFNPQAFVSYGQNGGGFGYASFTLFRKTGFDYDDIGYAYRLRFYKGPYKCLFDGQIVKITETKDRNGNDQIEIWALGWVHTATADVFNYIYADTRFTKWVSSEDASGYFKPQKFAWDNNDRLYLKPRRGETPAGQAFLNAQDYTYLRYTFEFGENAVRLTADYNLVLPATFPAKLQLLADDQLLFEATSTASGQIDVTATGKTTFEFRFAMTQTGDVTAEDDTVYALIENMTVYSLNTSGVDAADIAADLVSFLSVAGHGISDDTRRINTIGTTLLQAAFDNDQTPADIMAFMCQFGNANSLPVAWGISPDDRRLFYLESQDTTTIKYAVNPSAADTLERSGDWSESAQKVYGTYTDKDGVLQRTADQVDQDTIDALGGYFLRRVIPFTGVTEESAANVLLATWLSENGKPKTSGSYTVRSALTVDGRTVPADEIQPGGLVQVREFRAIEAELGSDDFRDKTTTFMLIGVKIDFDAHTAELMPDEESSQFERNMAIIASLQER